MPDEITTQEPEVAPQDSAAMTSPDFDWDAFWGNPVPNAEAAPPEPQNENYDDLGDDVEDEAAKELARLRKQTEANSKQLEELKTQKTIDSALEEWKKQATPAELALGDILYSSQNLEELKKNEALVKNAAKKAELIYGDALKEREAQLQHELQEKFGMPIPPSFQPIPQEEKASQALAEGDLDQAARIMLEGMF